MAQSTTTRTDGSSVAGRLPRWGAALAASAVILAACTGTPASPTTSLEGAGAPPTTPTPTTTTTTTTTTTVPIDAAALLADALAAYADGYRFSSHATVGDATAGDVTGIVLGDTVQMAVTSGGATVTYVITPEIRWVRVENGTWEELAENPPVAAPLAPLARPTSLVVTAVDGGEVTLAATYDAAAFGLPPGPLTMTLSFGDGRLTAASYTTGGDPAGAVVTRFSPLEAGVSITVPAKTP